MYISHQVKSWILAIVIFTVYKYGQYDVLEKKVRELEVGNRRIFLWLSTVCLTLWSTDIASSQEWK